MEDGAKKFKELTYGSSVIGTRMKPNTDKNIYPVEDSHTEISKWLYVMGFPEIYISAGLMIGKNVSDAYLHFEIATGLNVHNF